MGALQSYRTHHYCIIYAGVNNVAVAGEARGPLDHTHREQTGHVKVEMPRPTAVATSSAEGPLFNNTVDVGNEVAVRRYTALQFYPIYGGGSDLSTSM